MAKTGSIKTTAPTYRVPRYRIGLVREASYPIHNLQLTCSRTAADALRPLFEGLDREQFAICCLDAKHAIIGVNVVAIGSLTLAIVHPREVFKAAVLLNASAVICAHNHPSGDSTPSTEDTVLTHRLRGAGDLIGITLLDHLILGDGRTFSYADQGWPGTTKGELS